MNHIDPSQDRVEQALDIYRNIAACNAYLARGDDIYTLPAAMMLPCYRAAFEKLAQQMTCDEQEALMGGLQVMASPQRSSQI